MLKASGKRKHVISIVAVVMIIFAIFLLFINTPESKHQKADTAQENMLNNQSENNGVAPGPEEQPSESVTAAAPSTEDGTAKESPLPSVELDIPSFAESYSDYFPIGAAIEPFQTMGMKAELFKKHVSWLVAENVMKPDAIHPAEDSFNWDNADRIVEFAKANGMEVRFHTLVWHSQVGDWFFKDTEGKPMVDETDPQQREVNKKLLLQRLDQHVRTIVERYKDDIKSWDVVNEVVEPGDPDGMRASEWYKITGTDYIETAFRAARATGGPDIKLYLNDYGTDNPAKRDRIYELMKDMLDRGVPIDGIGHQTHISVSSPPVNSIIESMQKFSELGLDNLVTELDMSVYAWNDRSDYGSDIPDALLKKQADRYRELFEAFKANKSIVSGVVFWSIADDHTWLNSFPVKRTDAPLLFDQYLHAKPAFWAVVDPSRLVE